MKPILLTILCFICSEIIAAQSIITGQHGFNDFFEAVEPDTTVQCQGLLWGTYPIDINGDYLTDFELSVKCSDHISIGIAECSIIAKNSNQISYSYTDSCYGGTNDTVLMFVKRMAYAHNINETIDSGLTWKSNELMFAYKDYCTMDPCLYSCQDNSFGTSGSYYIGVRVFSSSDTLYGWIKVKGVNKNRITLEEYAGNKGNPGLIEEKKEKIISIYPNPVKDNLTILTQQISLISILEISNIYGQELMQQQLENRKTQIDISTLKSGIYILKIYDGENSYNKIFVKL